MSLPSDDAKFRMVFESHHEAIQRYCVRRLDADEANDAVAEVFLVAWRRIGDVPGSGEALPWLYRVAHNVVRHFYRSQRRHRDLTARAVAASPEPEPSPVVQIIQREEDAQIVAAMDRLRENDREVLRLRLWEDLSLDEVGSSLGISDRAAGMRYQRALRRLGRTLQSMEHRRAGAARSAIGGER